MIINAISASNEMLHYGMEGIEFTLGRVRGKASLRRRHLN